MSGEGLVEGLGYGDVGSAKDLAEIENAEIIYLALSPNEEFKLAYDCFQKTYEPLRAEELPERAYKDYRDLEDIYAECMIPSSENRYRINILRDVMQRYAEVHRN